MYQEILNDGADPISKERPDSSKTLYQVKSGVNPVNWDFRDFTNDKRVIK